MSYQQTNLKMFEYKMTKPERKKNNNLKIRQKYLNLCNILYYFICVSGIPTINIYHTCKKSKLSNYYRLEL